MAENSGIEWTTHTFNPWTGCTKVSPACDHCYAEGWAKRSGHVEWGPHGARRRTKTWGNPIKWNRAAEGATDRPRVFCASLADVFDNHRSIEPVWRRDLWRLIGETPNLDWLLLTKRPQNVSKFVPESWMIDGFPENVWLGTTVENQVEADRRIPDLLRLPVEVRFLSCEPLIGPVDISVGLGCTCDNDERCFGTCPYYRAGVSPARLSWVITGGESGPHYRPADPDWFRSLRDQCAEADIPFLFKQWEGRTQGVIKAKGRELDGVVHDGYPVRSAVLA